MSDDGSTDTTPATDSDETAATTQDSTEGQDVTEGQEATGKQGAAQAPVASDDDEVAALRSALGERTADLQRLQAEFLNYKRRVDRDREMIRENAVFSALSPVTEVLDTIDRAREHGPLEAGLKAVAEQLERSVASVGVVKFGKVGDDFDPTIHEALSHLGEEPGVSVPTCRVIARSGYRIGDRVLRAAQVLVVDPPSGAAPEADDASVSSEEPTTEAESPGGARGQHAAYPTDEG